MTRTPNTLWRAFERLAAGAVMVEWSRALGAEAPRAQAYLRLSDALADSHPCLNRLGCGLPHRVEERAPGRWEAVPGPEEWCPPFPVENKDLLVFTVDTALLCRHIARALGLAAPSHPKPAGVRVEPVGTYGPARSAVHLMLPADPASMMREVERLFGAHPDPFIILTPTGVHCTAEAESMLRRQACMHIPLAAALLFTRDGALAAAPAAGPMLNEFTRRATEGRGLVKTIERFDRNLEAVAKGNYELQREVDELRQFAADGCFKFALRVDAADFRAFAVIMALGNRKAAADFLRVPHRSFYDRVDKWSERGKDYQLMFRYMEWRKRSSRKIKLRLEDSVQSGEPNDAPENPETVGDVLDSISATDNRDYPKILADVMQTLQTQNARNWPAVRDELVDMIKEEVAG